ncbi:MAG: hypothetical protein ACPGUV_05635 [Polyangiales bacterium]
MRCVLRWLRHTVAALRGTAPDDEESYRSALICWSSVHGLATLWNDGAMHQKYAGRSIAQLAHLVTEAVSTVVAAQPGHTRTSVPRRRGQRPR